jgi:hypothetical protein
MGFLKSFGIVLIVAALFAVIGGLAGGLIGHALDLNSMTIYRSGLFRARPITGPVPFRVGLVLGATQASIVGLLVGCRLIRIVALSRVHPWDRVDSLGKFFWVAPVLVAFVILALLALGGAIIFMVGGIAGQQALYMADTRSKLERIEPILREAPYSGLSVEFSSAAEVYVVGSVTSEETKQSLKERLSSLFGDEEADFMCGTIKAPRKMPRQPHPDGDAN